MQEPIKTASGFGLNPEARSPAASEVVDYRYPARLTQSRPYALAPTLRRKVYRSMLVLSRQHSNDQLKDSASH